MGRLVGYVTQELTTATKLAKNLPRGSDFNGRGENKE